jgi:hypothetical protein
VILQSARKRGVAQAVAASLLVVGLIVGAGVVYLATPSLNPAKTTTTTQTNVSTSYATSFVTDTVVSYSTSIVTSTSISYITNTVTSTQTVVSIVTETPPTTVTVSGHYSSVGAGTTATAIHFISQSTGVSYPGTVSGGSYTISNLPNQDAYTVKIDYSYFGGGGTCTAGTLPVYIQLSQSTISANWTC